MRTAAPGPWREEIMKRKTAVRVGVAVAVLVVLGFIGRSPDAEDARAI